MAKRPRTDKQPPKTIIPSEPKIIAEATGTEDPFLQQRLVTQVYDTLWLPVNLSKVEQNKIIQSAISMLQGIKPTDEVEGMLATQMVATHNVAMECLRRTMIQNQSIEGRDRNLKHAAKLLSVYSRQIEVLNKHRGKGQQKITIERVNVEPGGQAIVGQVEAGKADVSPRNGGEPRTQAITNNPGETIKMDSKVGQTKSRRNS